MRQLHFLPLILLIVWSGCTHRTSEITQRKTVSEVDSLTDVYLQLQDSMWMAWQKLLKDETQRVNSLEAAVEHLTAHEVFSAQVSQNRHFHLKQHSGIKITTRTMADKHMVHEYDQACRTLMSEINSITAGNTAFKKDSNCLLLCHQVLRTEAETQLYRQRYDSLALAFNQFLARHQAVMKEIDPDCTLKEIPVFQAAR